MIRSRLILAAVLVTIVIASCGGQPGVTVSVAGVAVPMAQASTTQRTPCSTSVGDYPARPPLTSVRAPMPVTFQVDAGDGTTDIRGWIYDVEAPTPSGGPLEEFTVAGRSGKHQSRSIVPARTYEVLVSVRSSFFITQNDDAYVFRIRVEPGG